MANIPSVDDESKKISLIRLTPQVLGEVLSGEVTLWSDPKIQNLNSGKAEFYSQAFFPVQILNCQRNRLLQFHLNIWRRLP